MMPVLPSRTYPLFNDLVESLPVTFRAKTTDSPDYVYVVMMTAAGKILTVAPMTYISSAAEWRLNVQAPGTSHKVRFQWSGTPATGYCTISLFGNAARIPWNASAAEIQTALEELPDLNAGDVLVTGRPVEANGVTITMRNKRAGLSYLMDAQLGWWSESSLKGSGGTTLTTTRTIVTQGTGHVPNENAGHGDWYWTVVSKKDGLFNGDVQRFRFADRSAAWRWWYSAAPALTVSRPTADQVFTGTMPNFEWAIDDTNSSPIVYQEINYVSNATNKSLYFWATAEERPDGSTVNPEGNKRRDISGSVGDRQYRIARRGLLNNAGSFRAGFRVVNEAGQEAFVLRNFTIAFTPPAAVATFTGSPSQTGSYVDFTWSASTATAAQFDAYEIRWRYASETWDGSQEAIWSTSSQSTLTRRVMEYPLGQPIVFGLFVRTLVSGETLYSVAKEWRPPGGKIGIHGLTVISQAEENDRVYVVLIPRGDREVRPVFNRVVQERWGQETPFIHRDDTFYHVVSASYYALWDDPIMGGRASVVANLKTLIRSSVPNLYRDYQGRMFTGTLTSMSETDREEFPITDIPLVFTEGSAR